MQLSITYLCAFLTVVDVLNTRAQMAPCPDLFIGRTSSGVSVKFLYIVSYSTTFLMCYGDSADKTAGREILLLKQH